MVCRLWIVVSGEWDVARVSLVEEGGRFEL